MNVSSKQLFCLHRIILTHTDIHAEAYIYMRSPRGVVAYVLDCVIVASSNRTQITLLCLLLDSYH